MNKKGQIQIIILAVIIIVGVVIFLNLDNSKDTNNNKNENFVVAATFYPLYDLTRSVAGSEATVYSIVPSGVEPHDYEPSPGDIKKLNDASAFVTLGIEFEEFEENLVESVNPSVEVISAGSRIFLLDVEEDHHDEHEEEDNHEDEDHEEEDDHHHSGKDPHIWLSPNNAKIMAENIIKGLSKADPDNKEIYQQNGNRLVNDLKELDNKFSTELSSCKKDTILVNHNAFSYLAKDYGFETISISGLEPEIEPTPKQLTELIEEAREHDLKYIFYEELVDPRIANTIAREVGAQTLELNPLEGTNNPLDTYISLMEENLENLKIALECN